ncbi:MAG: hypothetical protein C0616_05495 [Desulfuromonas sp.]|nr:MAG: hypothetical protein C0616_05495 [Desulfuromonas sp.]
MFWFDFNEIASLDFDLNRDATYKEIIGLLAVETHCNVSLQVMLVAFRQPESLPLQGEYNR